MIDIGSADWKSKFNEALTQGSVAGIVNSLQAQATVHAGTANALVKRTAIQAIQRHYEHNQNALFQVSLDICLSGNPTTEEVGAHLLATCYEIDPSTVASVLHDLADNPNWEVREWVAGACGRILEQHFDRFYPTMEWANDESENVRRAVALAAMYAGKSRNLEFAEPILDVVEILLPDRSKYVRDNLATRAAHLVVPAA